MKEEDNTAKHMYKDYFEKIQQFYDGHRRMPSYREIMEATGLRSKNAVYKLVQFLVEEGLVEQDAQGKLLPGPLFSGVPLLGTVEAGFPSAAEEEAADVMSMDEYLIRNREASYLLRVSGDSMKNAGIMQGDLVLVERGATAAEGDIVIAEVDGAWTMKYLRRKGRRICLEAANDAYPDIYPEDELNIIAVVRAVVRRY